MRRNAVRPWGRRRSACGADAAPPQRGPGLRRGPVAEADQAGVTGGRRLGEGGGGP
ncbi:MAG TPA: hypothetical protein VNT01_01615 [Symbiobacteriaceae bacterium]|nr:hypothetical protein [Symbiobacteriaceae bacterium]